MSRKRVWSKMGDTFEHDSWIEDVDIICPGRCESDGTRCGWDTMEECATTRHLKMINKNTPFPPGGE